MKKILNLIIWSLLIAPSVVLAWMPGQPLVPDCARVGSGSSCHFQDVILQANIIIDFFIWMVAPISILIFSYIGWLYMSSGDNASKRGEAKNAFFAMLKGIFFLLGAYLIVKTIVTGLTGTFNNVL